MHTYVIISVIMTILTFLISQLKPSGKDIFQLLDELQNNIKELRDKGLDKLANFLENIVNSVLEGNPIPVILLMFVIYLIPIYRWFMFVYILKDKIK